MTEKYEKIGQATIYRQKKGIGYAPSIVGVVIFVIIIALLSEGSTNAQQVQKSLDLILNEPIPPDANKGVSNPSKLLAVKGESRLLRYVEGDGNITPYQFAVDTSKKNDRLVILVSTTEKYRSQAVTHAQTLAGWLERKLEDVSRVQIIIHPNNNGVGFFYYISGLTHWGDSKEVIVMTPDQATRALEDVVLTYKVRSALIERGEHLDVLN